jgi:hypothetical protein
LNYLKHDDNIACLTFILLDKEKLSYIYNSNKVFEIFNPNQIIYNKHSGRIYHQINNHRYLNNQYGLLSSNIANEISNNIIIINNDDNYQLKWKDNIWNIKSLSV